MQILLFSALSRTKDANIFKIQHLVAKCFERLRHKVSPAVHFAYEPREAALSGIRWAKIHWLYGIFQSRNLKHHCPYFSLYWSLKYYFYLQGWNIEPFNQNLFLSILNSLLLTLAEEYRGQQKHYPLCVIALKPLPHQSSPSSRCPLSWWRSMHFSVSLSPMWDIQHVPPSLILVFSSGTPSQIHSVGFGCTNKVLTQTCRYKGSEGVKMENRRMTTSTQKRNLSSINATK